MLVIGDKEMENGQVAVRTRKEADKGAMAVEQFIEEILVEIKNMVC